MRRYMRTSVSIHVCPRAHKHAFGCGGDHLSICQHTCRWRGTERELQREKIRMHVGGGILTVHTRKRRGGMKSVWNVCLEEGARERECVSEAKCMVKGQQAPLRPDM